MTNGGCFSPGDHFGTITSGQTICGTSGTFTVGGVNNSDEDIFQFTLNTMADVDYSATAEFCELVMLFQEGAIGHECDSAVVLAVVSAPPCSPVCISLQLPPGTYYGYVSTMAATGVPLWRAVIVFPLQVSRDLCVSGLCHFDQLPREPCLPPIIGSTVGAGDPCGIGIESELWQVDVLDPGPYRFDGCNSPDVYDQFLALFDQNGCCVNPLCFDDDGCGEPNGRSTIQSCTLALGTYYLEVSGFAPGDVGQYQISVGLDVNTFLHEFSPISPATFSTDIPRLPKI